MRHAVRHIHFVGVDAASSEQGSRLRDVSVREGRPMPKTIKLTRRAYV